MLVTPDGNGQREAALLELHDQYAELLRFAMWRTRGRQLSEDIVQEVLLRAWKDPGLGAARSGRGPRLALHSLHNLIIDRWRSAASRAEQRMEDPPEKAPATRPAWYSTSRHAEALASLSTEQHSPVDAAYCGRVDRRYLCPAPQPRERTVKSLHYRTQNRQIGPTGERSDPAVNAVPDKFAQWDAVSRPRISSPQLAGM